MVATGSNSFLVCQAMYLLASRFDKGGWLIGSLLPSLSLQILRHDGHRVFAETHTVSVEGTGSLPRSEVKRHNARLKLVWGTAWEILKVMSGFPLPSGTRFGNLGNIVGCICIWSVSEC